MYKGIMNEEFLKTIVITFLLTTKLMNFEVKVVFFPVLKVTKGTRKVGGHDAALAYETTQRKRG